MPSTVTWNDCTLMGHRGKGVLVLDDNGVWLTKGGGRLLALPWADVTSIEVDSHENVSRRITATRLVAVGIFALAIPKERHASYLVLTTAGNTHIVSIPRSLMSVRAAVQPYVAARSSLAKRPPAQALAERRAAEAEATRLQWITVGVLGAFVVPVIVGLYLLLNPAHASFGGFDNVTCGSALYPYREPVIVLLDGTERDASTTGAPDQIRAACDAATHSRLVRSLLAFAVPFVSGAGVYYFRKRALVAADDAETEATGAQGVAQV